MIVSFDRNLGITLHTARADRLKGQSACDRIYPIEI